MQQKLFNRDFTMVAIGQLISLFGNAILRFALSLYILDLTGAAAVFGTVTAVSVIPMILLSPFGGMIADRVNRRNIMVILDFATSFLVLGFGLMLSSQNAVLLIGVTLFLLSVIQACYTPSVHSSVPLLQTEENLVRANAVVNQVTMLANLIGPVLGGILYGFFGAVLIVFASGVCFFLSALLETWIRIPYQKREAKESALSMIKSDWKESVRFLSKEQPDILRIMLIAAVYNFFLGSVIMVGMPYMIRTVLGLGSELYGAAEGLMAAAGLAGGILSGWIAGKGKTQNMFWLLVVSGLMLLPAGGVFLFDFPPMICYLVIAVCFMVLQLLITVFSILMLSATQKRTPDSMLGKVTAYIMALTMCVQPLGQAVYGILFDRFAGSLYLLLSATALTTAIIGFLSKKTFGMLQRVC